MVMFRPHLSPRISTWSFPVVKTRQILGIVYTMTLQDLGPYKILPGGQSDNALEPFRNIEACDSSDRIIFLLIKLATRRHNEAGGIVLYKW